MGMKCWSESVETGQSTLNGPFAWSIFILIRILIWSRPCKRRYRLLRSSGSNPGYEARTTSDVRLEPVLSYSQTLRPGWEPGCSSRSSWRWWSRSSGSLCSGRRGSRPSCWWRWSGPSPWPAGGRERVSSVLTGSHSGSEPDGTHLDLHVPAVDDLHDSHHVVEHQAHLLTAVCGTQPSHQINTPHRPRGHMTRTLQSEARLMLDHQLVCWGLFSQSEKLNRF